MSTKELENLEMLSASHTAEQRKAAFRIIAAVYRSIRQASFEDWSDAFAIARRAEQGV